MYALPKLYNSAEYVGIPRVGTVRSSGTPVPEISGQIPRRIGHLHGEWYSGHSAIAAVSDQGT
jgi:hypothetical protein